MPILEFVFRSFWTFAGTIILAYVACTSIGVMISMVVAAFKGGRVLVSLFGDINEAPASGAGEGGSDNV